MNLNMIKPRNETEDLILSITKNCETLIEQTHTKPRDIRIQNAQIKRNISFQTTNSNQRRLDDWINRSRSI